LGPHVTGLLKPVGPHEQGLLETAGVTVAGHFKHGLLNVAPAVQSRLVNNVFVSFRHIDRLNFISSLIF
jgi:hypothetical protein